MVVAVTDARWNTVVVGKKYNNITQQKRGEISHSALRRRAAIGRRRRTDGNDYTRLRGHELHALHGRCAAETPDSVLFGTPMRRRFVRSVQTSCRTQIFHSAIPG